MKDKNFTRENVPSIDRLLSQMEKMQVPELGPNEPVRCDLCSDPIYPNRYMESYVSDLELTTRQRDMGIQRIYCEECSVGRVKYPMKGVLEMIVSGSISTDRYYQNLELEDYSVKQDGYNWSPVEVSEKVFKMPIEVHAQMTGGMKIGPEDIVDALHHMNIDIRDVLDDEGNVAIDAETQAMIDQKMLEKAQEYINDPEKMDRVSNRWSNNM